MGFLNRILEKLLQQPRDSMGRYSYFNFIIKTIRGVFYAQKRK